MPRDTSNRLDLGRPDIANYLRLFDAYNAAPRGARDGKLIAVLFEEAGDALIGTRPRPRNPEHPFFDAPGRRYQNHSRGLGERWERLPPE